MTAEFWRDRSVLVTGGTGLLGGWLVGRLLRSHASVVTLVRDRVPGSRLFTEHLDRVAVVEGDVCDQAAVERAMAEYEVTVVFHLAAQTIVGIANRNPVSTFESNVRGTWTVLEAARRSPLVRAVILASSDKAYGAQATLPYKEDTPLQGRHPYDASKSCADLIAQSFAATFQVPVAITRCGNFYGGGDLNWNRIVPGTIRSVLRQEPPVIRSNGLGTRDYLYVEDGAGAYMLLAERLVHDPNLAGEAFNFANDAPITTIALVQRILALMHSELEPVIRDEARHEIPDQYLCSDKARSILRWEPEYDLEQGLLRTIDWYSRYLRART
ncbi:MAG: NAD-dependent epimerase/dehydratase family protein [Chthonomonadales bacterium]|nr:NAD-dependent epimerase/dehydratase family protein [Chthonomonadales bacterium]